MIIPDFLFDFYRKVNYFGDILIPFLLFYFLIMVAVNGRTADVAALRWVCGLGFGRLCAAVLCSTNSFFIFLYQVNE
jgi:hypothetical protein